MDSDDYKWKVGAFKNLPEVSRVFMKKGSTTYKHFYGSRFVCIREEDAEHPGILMKAIGLTSLHEIIVVGGESFCMDEGEDLLSGKVYSSFRFPTVEQLTEALAILRENPSLMTIFDDLIMPFDLNSTFWVREPVRNFLFQKKPQFYDARTGTLSSSSYKTLHNRLTMVYFRKGELIY